MAMYFSWLLYLVANGSECGMELSPRPTNQGLLEDAGVQALRNMICDGIAVHSKQLNRLHLLGEFPVFY